jgi:hypothetical protein
MPILVRSLLAFSLLFAACVDAPTVRPDPPLPHCTAPVDPAVRPEGELPSKLDKRAVVTSLSCVKFAVAECYDLYQNKGEAGPRITVAPSGEVESVVLTAGSLAQTQEGECIRRMATAARFPRFAGPSQTIDYPFMLR